MFFHRFRNITRIMDCVNCEKCKVWGKLQFIGIGTAIKILISSEEEINSPNFFSRQEIIALINTLHQLTKSIKFASDASDLELIDKIKGKINIISIISLIVTIIFGYFHYSKHWKSNKK